MTPPDTDVELEEVAFIKHMEADEARRHTIRDTYMRAIIERGYSIWRGEAKTFSRIRKQHDTARYVGPGAKS